MASKLGEKLRACRTSPKVNLTLEEAARRAGLSKSYLWELENRESKKPSAEKLQAIADVLGQDVSFFLDDTIDTPQESNKDKDQQGRTHDADGVCRRLNRVFWVATGKSAARGGRRERDRDRDDVVARQFRREHAVRRQARAHAAKR